MKNYISVRSSRLFETLFKTSLNVKTLISAGQFGNLLIKMPMAGQEMSKMQLHFFYTPQN